jgi:toxin YoeB
MDSLTFQTEAWEEYLEWEEEDKKIFKRINTLIKDIQRNGMMKGIGKPEVLKEPKRVQPAHQRRHRLVYVGDENRNLRILSCKYHYDG